MYKNKVVSKKQEKVKKAKRRRSVKRTVIFLLVLVLAVGIAVAVYFFAKPFKISALRFESDDPEFESYARPLVEEYLGQDALGIMLKYGGLKNLGSVFEGKMTKIEQELAFALPQYKNITATFGKNRFLKITGEPRGSYVILSENGEMVVTDRTGEVVLVCDRDSLAEEAKNFAGIYTEGPVVSGLGIEGYAIGLPVEYSADVPWKEVMGIYFAVLSDEALSENVTFIYLPGLKSPYFYCNKNIVVKLGDASDEKKIYSRLERLSAIFRSNNEQIHDGTLTLSDTGGDVFRPDAEEAYPVTPSPAPTATPTPTPDPDNDTPAPTEEETSTPTEAPVTARPTNRPTPTRTPTPTPTPTEVEETPAEETPTPTPEGETPTPVPGDETPTPTPVPGDETPTPTPVPGDETPTPTPPPGDETPTPTPVPDDETPTPTPVPDDETPTPTPVPDGETPTPVPDGGSE